MIDTYCLIIIYQQTSSVLMDTSQRESVGEEPAQLESEVSNPDLSVYVFVSLLLSDGDAEMLL